MPKDLSKMHPKLYELYIPFKTEADLVGLPFIVTCVERTILEQMALFVQGRLDVSNVNLFRTSAGLSLIKPSENHKVTWTLNSYHVVNYFDKDLNNDYSRAFDVALLKFNRPHWDIKISVNENEIPDYEELGLLGKKHGLVWGGGFRNPDRPHFQLPERLLKGGD